MQIVAVERAGPDRPARPHPLAGTGARGLPLGRRKARRFADRHQARNGRAVARDGQGGAGFDLTHVVGEGLIRLAQRDRVPGDAVVGGGRSDPGECGTCLCHMKDARGDGARLSSRGPEGEAGGWGTNFTASWPLQRLPRSCHPAGEKRAARVPAGAGADEAAPGRALAAGRCEIRPRLRCKAPRQAPRQHRRSPPPPGSVLARSARPLVGRADRASLQDFRAKFLPGCVMTKRH